MTNLFVLFFAKSTKICKNREEVVLAKVSAFLTRIILLKYEVTYLSEIPKRHRIFAKGQNIVL